MEKQTKKVVYNKKENKVEIEFEFKGPLKDGEEVVGQTVENYKQVYNPEWVKKKYEGIARTLEDIEKVIKETQVKVDTTILKRSEDELKAFVELQEELKKFNALEKAKMQLENLHNNKKTLQEEQKELSKVMKEISK